METLGKRLAGLFRECMGENPTEVTPLPRSGSDRCYFRMGNGSKTIIGAYNADVTENEAFFSFTKAFGSAKLNVPKIYGISQDRTLYLQEDLGKTTLYDKIKAKGPDRMDCLRMTLAKLPIIQVEAAKNIPFDKCYPRSSFDRRSILWDLNYFKYEFLKIAAIPFNEDRLEDDFEKLTEYLLSKEMHFFMYRDFQSRNVMWYNDEPYFIDYQGGRKGPLQYDVASLLFSPKTDLSISEHIDLLNIYKSELAKLIAVPNGFDEDYYLISILRLVQALGAYGFRGLVENKPNFKTSIPKAIANLNWILRDHAPKLCLPELYSVIEKLGCSPWAKPFELEEGKLTVRITSFSYKKRMPIDPSENGGGFVIDCRGIPNPGRLKEYQSLSGKDSEVIAYLEQYSEVAEFLQSVKQMVAISINDYIARGFNHLCISFGCTGGQHRSVYNAQKVADWISANFPVNVVLVHQEEGNWKKTC